MAVPERIPILRDDAGARIDAAIGNTPVVRLTRVVEPGMAEVWVKIEGMNPGGSIKDRTALGMIVDAEQSGALRPGQMIVEPTSGNTGIGLAQVAAARGYPLTLCLPAQMSEERKRTLLAYGARLVLTDPERRMLAAIEEAERIRDSTGAWLANQFANPANPRVHYETTAPELWRQMHQQIDAFVYGSGTGGTISGVGRFLRERSPHTLVIAVEPAEAPCSPAASVASISSRVWVRVSYRQTSIEASSTVWCRRGRKMRFRSHADSRAKRGSLSGCRVARSPGQRSRSRASSDLAGVWP
jgi:cysteine synthase